MEGVRRREDFTVNFLGQERKWSGLLFRGMGEGRRGIEAAKMAKAEMGKGEVSGSRSPSAAQASLRPPRDLIPQTGHPPQPPSPPSSNSPLTALPRV